jgi:hypothetical protein
MIAAPLYNATACQRGVQDFAAIRLDLWAEAALVVAIVAFAAAMARFA